VPVLLVAWTSHCASPTGVDLDSRTVLVLLAWMIAVKLACDPSRDAATRTFFLSFSDIFLSDLDAILLSSDSKFDLSNC